MPLPRILSFGRRRAATIPFDMFDHERTEREARAAHKLERLYHRGQDRAWNGKELLAELVEKHGGVQIAADKLPALQRVFAIILWGELAAWKVAAELALRLEPLEARMAATSQAHDEARHFYVMYDYLKLLGPVPRELQFFERLILDRVLETDSLAKKLTGMHLMVEPTALTLFQVVREHRIEPVLADLLWYYERDEARHVALGVQYLPELIQAMGPLEAAEFGAWQMSMIAVQMLGLRDLSPALLALDIDPKRILQLGHAKQLLAGQMLSDQMGGDLKLYRLMDRVLHVHAEMAFPDEGLARDLPSRLARAAWVAVNGKATVATSLDPGHAQGEAA